MSEAVHEIVHIFRSSPDLGVISIISREFPTGSFDIHVPNQSLLPPRGARVRSVKVTGLIVTSIMFSLSINEGMIIVKICIIAKV